MHSYRRLQNKRAKRPSGGLIIYIREQYQKGVKKVKNDIDCLIWLKFDKNFFQIQNDIYLAVTYIAPENSPVHSVYEIDIFQKLQLDISYYKEKGKVFVCGDLNCRTASKADYIENDRHIFFQDSDDVDVPLQRISMDHGANRFEEFLLDVCKAVNMRIVNGRLFNDKAIGKFTCTMHNGESVVDYLLTSQEDFAELSHFSINDFNIYSNHAPISFINFRIANIDPREETRTSWQSESKKDAYFWFCWHF